MTGEFPRGRAGAGHCPCPARATSRFPGGRPVIDRHGADLHIFRRKTRGLEQRRPEWQQMRAWTGRAFRENYDGLALPTLWPANRLLLGTLPVPSF